MTGVNQLKRQIAQILDETTSKQIDVIVQMGAPRPAAEKHLTEAASIALSRRRMSLTARELLPASYRSYRKSSNSKHQQETASTRSLLGRATRETLALARIQKMGKAPLQPLIKSGLIQTAISRMIEPARKSGNRKTAPQSFWTSRSMPLRLHRDELANLPGEVTNIKAVHLNRTLNVPRLLEMKPLQLEAAEILSTTWGLLKINALAAWGATGWRGEGVAIGLLDTGIDAAHPDLQGKVTHWAEFNSLGQLIPSQPYDSDEHGTHCAGVLVGGNHSGRYIGVAPAATLKTAMVLDGEEGGTDAQVLAGIDWCVEQGVDVISMSLGGLIMDAQTPPTYTEAILTCIQAGIPVVAAIGNEGEQTTGSPGNDLFALSVGATDPDDRVAGFSGGRTQILRESDYIDPQYLPLSYSKPELTAPGVAIFSAVPGGEWKVFSGTSMATPHVAGAIALLLSATNIQHMEGGEHKAYLIQDLITGSVQELGESGQDHRHGFGRLDVLKAIDFAVSRGYGR